MQWPIIIPMFCQPIWQWFCKAAFAAGLIATVDVPVAWVPPKIGCVKPLQDAATDLLETRAGLSTIAQQIARRGYDPRKVLEEWHEYALLADTMSLIFDSDPRKAGRGGQVQSPFLRACHAPDTRADRGKIWLRMCDWTQLLQAAGHMITGPGLAAITGLIQRGRS